LPPDAAARHAKHAGYHPGCFVCSPSNPRGLRVRFEPASDGSVRGRFDCERFFEGYPHIIHGGVLTALLDEAMLHCLLARDLPAVTVDLSVQFRHPVTAAGHAAVRARVVECSPPLYHLTAEVTQAGQVKTRARGRFVVREPGR
jgi:acyl-coenzyme A thioesterase PaaI-like protein